MFCDACEYRAFVGNSNVCGYFLHGGETVYIDSAVSNWCPKNELNVYENTELLEKDNETKPK